jgi:hypothetical protein
MIDRSQRLGGDVACHDLSAGREAGMNHRQAQARACPGNEHDMTGEVVGHTHA